MISLMVKICCFLLCALVVGCTVHDARPSENQYLIIASDCLKQKDSSIFNAFKKRNGIRVYVIHMSCNKIIEKLQKESYATRIDAVILQSVFNAKKISDLKLLQRIPENENNIAYNSYFSKEKTYFGLGFDPYILVCLNDSTSRIANYNALTKENHWCSDLDSVSDWYPFYASMITHGGTKNNFNWSQWMRDFSNNRQVLPSVIDSSFTCAYYFTLFSHLKQDKKTIKNINSKEVIFPNQSISGTYANMPIYGVVRQAANFNNARLLLEYLQSEPGNKEVNRAINTFPLESSLKSKYVYRQQSFEIHMTPAMQVVENFERVKSLLTAAKKIKQIAPVDTISVE